MNASLLAVLNDAERLLVTETERAGLAALDAALAGEREAAGQHPGHGGPPAGEARQPMSTAG
jgi:hypothetical protein